MSDDDITGRDARVIWKTITYAVVIAVSCVSALVYGVSEWVTMRNRIETVEKWQASKDKEAQRELWRRDRERNGQQFSPGLQR